MDSAQKMERILRLEQELRWAEAKVQSRQSDLDRLNQKLAGKPELEKSQKRSLELESELAKAQDQLMWRLQ